MAVENVASEEVVTGRVETYWYLVGRRLRKDKLAIVSLVVLIFIILACLIGPYIMPYKFSELGSIEEVLQPPSRAHLLGTDELGRDVLTRLFYGGRISLLVGFASVVSALVVGVIVGAYAGYYGGILDTILMRFTDIMFSIPVMPLLIVLSSVMPGAGVWKIVLVIAIFGWMSDARIVRAMFLSLRENEYVEAAKAIGVSNNRIIGDIYYLTHLRQLLLLRL